jgi:hypothetical protein
MNQSLELLPRILCSGGFLSLFVLLAMLGIIMLHNLRESGEASRFEVFCMWVILTVSASASMLMATAAFFVFLV